MANANGRSKTTLTGSGIDSGAQPAGTAKMVYAAPSAPIGVKLEHGILDGFAHHSIRFGNIPEIGSWQNAFSIPRARSMPQGHDRRNAVSNAGRSNHSSKKTLLGEYRVRHLCPPRHSHRAESPSV